VWSSNMVADGIGGVDLLSAERNLVERLVV
jgi:hypothetical protein